MRGCALAGLFHLTDQIQGQLTDTELLEQHTFVRKTLFDVATIEEFHQVRRPHLVVCSRLLTASFAQYLLGPLHRTLYTSGTVAGGEHKHEGTIFGVNYIIGGELRVVGALYEPWGLTLLCCVYPGVKISQLRVEPYECRTLHGMRHSKGVSCYGDEGDKGGFSLDVESKESYGENGVSFSWSGASAFESW